MPKVDQAHSDARRRQILDAAIACISEQGIHETTMRDIIERSGLSTGAIYQYFKSKAEMVVAIAGERHAKEREMIGLAATNDEAIESLRSLARSFLALLRDPQERKRRRAGVHLWAEALHDSEILDIARAGVDEPLAELVELVKTAQRQGALPGSLHAEGFARTIIAIFQGFILQQAWDEKADLEGYASASETIIDALFELARMQK
jgi:AcrR family transcriptional regulator